MPTAEAAASDLFFSEYIEGSSFNKALEIYNGTGAPVNLATAGYTVEMYFNGGTTAGFTVGLTGTVADNATFVLAPTNANTTILAAANQTAGTSWFNGDDAVVLKKSGVIIDSIGQIGFDPGTEWGSGNASTADNTIRRKSNICAGDANATNVFDPSIEWDGFATDTFNGLGSHTAACGGGSTNPSGTGAANPSSVAPGGTTLLTVAVTPGTNPTSTGLVVSANLTAIGGAANQQFFDNGSNGDVTPNDNTFSFSATVANGTTGGAKSMPATITDAQSRSGSANISLTVVTPTNPSGVGSANPSSVQAGGSTLLTVAVTPGANPTSTGITVTGDLSSIGGSAAQTFFDNGSNGDATPNDNTFSFNATVPVATTTGGKTLPVQIADAQSRTASTSISLSVQEAPVLPGAVVVSQVYGGGGNSGADFKNDFVEIFNRSANPVNLTGWSVQYGSSGGTTWQRTPLTNVTLQPGQYYLIQEGAGSGGTDDLPTPDAVGTINMSATSGKIALVRNNVSLNGTTCADWLADPDLMDMVGYGGANCFEGSAPAPGLGNETAALRARNGCKDTDYNAANFTEGSPAPRNTSSPFNSCPLGDPAPEVFSTTPSSGASHVAVTSNVTINFDEPVNAAGSWYEISCATSGTHTATAAGGPTDFTLDPDTDFANNEQCTVTVFAAQVNDLDTQDPPDNMAADYTFSFTTEFARDPAEHLALGNPSGAAADLNNYLMAKIQYGLSYNCDRGTANWVSWHLDQTWLGSAPRQDDFRPDPDTPAGCYVVQGTDYSGSGFDRGHMTPSADRTSTVPDNSATFFMTNMIPQAPDNNQGPWAVLEGYARILVNQGNEVYIVSGGVGVGGVGSNGARDTVANGHVTVPAQTWKVLLVLPDGVGDDAARVDSSARTIAVLMPNQQGIRNDDWQKYLTTVDHIEQLTGYDFFSNVSDEVEAVIESRLDDEHNTAPVADSQSASTAEDTQVSITLTASDFNVNNTLTYTVVDAPAHGTLSGTGANLTYTPEADYNGPDSFTFKASDGTKESEPATVTISVSEVNDGPTANADGKATNEDTPLTFPASDLTANDGAGAANESGQTLTVTQVVSTPNTHGTVSLNGGQITYTPAANYHGPASFDYQVCDNGTTNGAPDAKCATGTVNVNVMSVNDAPVLAPIGDKTVFLGGTLTFTASGSDTADEPSTTLTYSLTGAVPFGASINASTGEFSWTPTAAQAGATYTFGVRVTDDGNPSLSDEETITVSVAHNWSGFLQPINADGSSIFKLGRTVPVKFRLTGASAGNDNLVARLLVAKISNGVAGTEMEAESTSNATTGNLFRSTGDGQYMFNLSTDNLTAGTYQLRVDMGDGVLRAVNISLRN